MSFPNVTSLIARNAIRTSTLYGKSSASAFHCSAALRYKIDMRSAEERYQWMYRYRFIPSKYRVALSAHQRDLLEKSTKGNNENLWSDNSKEHPLPEDPMVDYPQPLPDGGLQYYGFQFYPPHIGEVEHIPKEEISPLFMVRRVKRMKGESWYHKDILEKLGLGKDKSMSEVVIVKNIPEMNAILYAVNHFIQITPIKISPDVPLDADPKDCYLNEEGEFTYKPSKVIPLEELELKEEDNYYNKTLTPDLIKVQSNKNYIDAWELVPQ